MTSARAHCGALMLTVSGGIAMAACGTAACDAAACDTAPLVAGVPPLALAVSARVERRGPAAGDLVPVLARARRVELIVGSDGLERSLARVALPRDVIDQLDAAFLGRLDLFAHAGPGTALTLWTVDGVLVAARVAPPRDAPIMAARYQGVLAPPGFYDQDGRALRGQLLARPVALGRITSRFGDRFDALAGHAARHHGVDYGVPVGTPVVAVARGRVKAVGEGARAGKFVKLVHANGYHSSYLHLSVLAPGVKAGALVEQGQVIAVSGNTGRSTGPHLHYELRVAGLPVDPHATLPPPAAALGPRARREHLAHIRSLEETR
ncbi:MAG: M23 family metallopeptidase [Deltaproteobacteria bacterium]|nr:M23 family metallopeptidase [Deltaproteobacteria bacterium]